MTIVAAAVAVLALLVCARHVQAGIIVQPTMDIEKFVNGNDADVAPGITVPAGSPVAFSYLVTASTPVPRGGFSIIDDNGTPLLTADDFAPAYVSGDAGALNILEPDETWVYAAVRTAVLGQYTNTGSVFATFDADNCDFDCTVPGPPLFLLDSDPANYVGVPEPASLALLGAGLLGLGLARRKRSA